jgi:hypothetical protein
MRFYGVSLVRMAQSMTYQHPLTVVKRNDAVQFVFNRLKLCRFFLNVFMSFSDCPHNNLKVINDKVGKVIIIGFCIKKGTAVFGGMAANDLRY